MRRVLTASSVLSLVLGLWVIVGLPTGAELRLLAAAVWTAIFAVEYRRRRTAQQQLQRIQVHVDGSVALLGANGVWSSAELARDCVVLARLAWIRVRTSGGRLQYELLRGCARESEDWRRFQVIWRHLPGRRRDHLGSGS